jgi:hypothetical protein
MFPIRIKHLSAGTKSANEPSLGQKGCTFRPFSYRSSSECAAAEPEPTSALSAALRGLPRLPRQRRVRSRGAPLPPKGSCGSPTSPRGGRLGRAPALAALIVPVCRATSLLLCLAGTRRLQRNSGAACFRKPNGDRLLRRTRAVLPLPDVFDFLANKLAGCSAGPLSFPKVFLCPLNGSLLWHGASVTLQTKLGTAEARHKPSRHPTVPQARRARSVSVMLPP